MALPPYWREVLFLATLPSLADLLPFSLLKSSEDLLSQVLFGTGDQPVWLLATIDSVAICKDGKCVVRPGFEPRTFRMNVADATE